jgi:peptide/nickel transport system permease protein
MSVSVGTPAPSFDPVVSARSSRRSILRRVWARRNGRAGLIIVVAMVLFGLVSLVGISPHGPNDQDVYHALKGPSWSHFFGTDSYGRDVFSRVQHGILLTLEISVIAVAICTVIGTLAGVTAGFLGGIVSASIMGIADMLFAVPSILLALAIVTALGPGVLDSALAIGIGYAPIFARVVRGPVLAVREADYVKAGTVLGFSRRRLLFRHILPAVSGVLVVQITLALGWAILTEASLSFLGLGPPPPASSLGLMVADGTNFARIAWWNLAFPAAAICALIIGFNLLGDALRDVYDPTSGRD